MRILLLNGPARSGKDNFARMLADQYNKNGTAIVLKFAKPLKEAAHRMFGFDVPHDYFEDVKDEPQAYLPVLIPGKPNTWRNVYIWLSEVVVKPNLGKDHWGLAAISQVRTAVESVLGGNKNGGVITLDKILVIFSDSGFLDESVPMVEAFGQDVQQIQIFRPGKTFEGDSRSYWEMGAIKKWEVHNSGTLHGLQSTAIATLKTLGLND